MQDILFIFYFYVFTNVALVVVGNDRCKVYEKREVLQRLHSLVREAFSFGIRHISL